MLLGYLDDVGDGAQKVWICLKDFPQGLRAYSQLSFWNRILGLNFHWILSEFLSFLKGKDSFYSDFPNSQAKWLLHGTPSPQLWEDAEAAGSPESPVIVLLLQNCHRMFSMRAVKYEEKKLKLNYYWSVMGEGAGYLMAL